VRVFTALHESESGDVLAALKVRFSIAAYVKLQFDYFLL
jgi:hypothetical protein